eukprot:4302776-Amphidinium_carterae.1
MCDTGTLALFLTLLSNSEVDAACVLSLAKARKKFVACASIAATSHSLRLVIVPEQASGCAAFLELRPLLLSCAQLTSTPTSGVHQ